MRIQRAGRENREEGTIKSVLYVRRDRDRNNIYKSDSLTRDIYSELEINFSHLAI